MIPDISIIIPSLGKVSNLDRLVKSILIQNKENMVLEVIVVLNGNKALANRAKISEWAEPYNHILKLEFSDKIGVNTARNRGVESASAGVLVFFDDDCVLDNRNFLARHLLFHRTHSDVFAYGGGYTLTEQAGFWDRMYNYMQMQWLYSGVCGDMSSQNPETTVLLGGNFSLKSENLLKAGLSFDEKIIYGGSEYEFFKKARFKKMKMILVDLNVLHYTQEGLLSVSRKIYKQGQGKAHIDSKYGAENQLGRNSNVELGLSSKLIMIYFNYVFWVGYYSATRSLYKLIPHMARDLTGNFNKVRYKFLNKLSDLINSKKNQGDRF